MSAIAPCVQHARHLADDVVTRRPAVPASMLTVTLAGFAVALPSLYALANLLMALAVLAATRSAWIRALAVALTLSMDAAVVLAADRYALRALAGASLITLNRVVASRLEARPPRPGPADRSG